MSRRLQRRDPCLASDTGPQRSARPPDATRSFLGALTAGIARPAAQQMPFDDGELAL